MTHGRILLRSPKDIEKNLLSNIDVVFEEVDYLELSCLSFTFAFSEPTAEEVRRANRQLKRPLPNHTRLYALESDESRYLVVAGSLRISENMLEIHESSLKPWGDCS